VGWLNRIFGDPAHLPGNTAALVTLLALVLFTAVLFFAPNDAGVTKKDALDAVSDFLSLALGFLFGQSVRK
jgi:hypothetical protein